MQNKYCQQAAESEKSLNIHNFFKTIIIFSTKLHAYLQYLSNNCV